MQEELDAHKEHDTWELVTRKPGIVVLHVKWVVKTKTNAEGSIERYKARIVARGDEQVFGLNYSSTFTPVMAMQTAMLIQALGMRWGVYPQHGDVPNAYVKADTEEGLEIYLQIPPGMKLADTDLKKLA